MEDLTVIQETTFEQTMKGKEIIRVCNTYSQLVLAVGKLAKIAVETGSFFFEVAANLGLEPWVGGARSLAGDG